MVLTTDAPSPATVLTTAHSGYRRMSEDGMNVREYAISATKNTGLRPSVSDIGARNIGPTAIIPKNPVLLRIY